MKNHQTVANALGQLGALGLLVAALAISTSAQTNKGSITGTVKDQQGAAVVGATVTVTNTETNAERTVKTNDDGGFDVPLLDPGIYRITVSQTNFSRTIQENVTVQTESKQAVDVVLQPASVGADVTITTAPQLVETESSDRGSVVTGREVTELPLSGRNFTQLATLTPGVSRVTIGTLSDARANNNGDPNAGGQGPGGGDSRGSTEAARFARSGGAVLSANGQRPTNNNFSVDGVDNNEPQFGTIGVFVNPDAIAEFKVTTSVPPAEIGRAGGAVINTTFRSGTNEFHGSLYYYGQNSRLNAYHPILKRNRNEAIARNDINLPVKAVQQIHEFGGTIGGPIVKDRFFFFFDYLGGRNNLPTPLSSTVPTADVRNGIFGTTYTSTRDCGRGISGVICDATTGLPFANATIPAGRISPQTRTFFNLFPSATATRLNPGQNDNNFFSQRDVKEKIDNFDIKLDYKVSDDNSLSGRFSRQNFSAIRGSFFPQVPAGFGAGNEIGNTRQLVVTDTHTFSPTILNEFRFGFTKINIGIINCGVGGACGISETFSADVGIPNVNNGTFEQSGSILTGGFGNGFVEFAGDGGPFIVNSKNPYFADTLTIIKGNHTIKFGGELRLRYLETIDGGRTGGLKANLAYADNGPSTGTNLSCPVASQGPSFNPATGSGCFVDSNGIAFGGTGLAIANLLDNRVAALQTFRGSVPGGAFNLRGQEYGFFVQDDFKVNDKLTLNLGLRYDLFPASTEKSGRLGNYDPVTRTVLLASGSDDSLIETDKNNFGPRVGFAYAFGPERNMVVRGGYGLLYTLDATDRPPLVNNPPFTNSITFNNAFDSSTPRSVFNLTTGPPNVPTISPSLLISPGGAITVFRQDPQQKTALVHQFNIGYQMQLGRDYALDIGYVGNRTRSLLQTLDIGGSGTAEARNTAGTFLSGRFYTNRARANYDALQMQLQKRLSGNIQGQISYTFSRNRDDSTGVFQGIGEGRGSQGGPQNPFDLEAEYGRSSLDVPHLLSANAIIDLPFGKGQRYMNSSATADKILGGLQLNIIVNGRSGFPFTVVDGDNGNRRANVVGDPFSGAPAGRYLNRAAFGGPTGACPGPNCVVNAAGSQIRFGTQPRNLFKGPGFIRTDFSVFKNTGLLENLKMQIGIEFFNLFNQATYTVPNNNFRDGGGFGRFDAALPGRVVQYRLKFLF
ncbi:MAG: TonB-dependent receptor [Pyrinomonadaceae bacterium]|nr:TonB-dependent receptor [Pyrinomonadaceae bacterium]